MKNSPIKPKIWLRYVDDTFCIIKDKDLNTFFEHINSIHTKTRFTKEVEKDQCLAFLDVKVIRKGNKLGHTVYRKPTHTDLYLNATSHHHPAQLNSVVSSLINRAHNICDEENLQGELLHVEKVLINNGYRKHQIKASITKRKKGTNKELPDHKVFLPYVKGISDKIGKMLNKYKVKAIFKPPPKIRQYLRSTKMKIPYNTPGVYRVPCSCGKSYVGETKRSISTRLDEHIKAVKNQRTDKSAIYEHLNDEPGHFIHFNEAEIIAQEKAYVPRLVREAIEIKRTPNFNRDQSFMLSRSWEPVLNTFSTKKRHVNKKTDTVSVVCKPGQRTESNSPPNEEPPRENNHRYPLRSLRPARRN